MDSVALYVSETSTQKILLMIKMFLIEGSKMAPTRTLNLPIISITPRSLSTCLCL